jgi:molecular chaperone DnaK
MTYSLGVDLGTTFSAAAVADGGRAEVFTLGTVAPAIPSIVVLRADGEVLVGEAADRRALTEPTRTAREFKRRLGDPAPFVLGGTPYGAEALMARMLRWIVDAVSQRQGGAPGLIAITHPANYGPYKLDLLREMVRLADVGPVTFISEPEAAAINYAERDRLEPGQLVAVYDFGGGTFDAAVLRKTATGFEVLGTPEGMERLGGIDFDQAIFSHVNDAVDGRIQEADTSDPSVRTALARLRADCRAAKESLSTDTDVTIPIVLPGLHTEVRLTRPEFEAMVRPRLEETVASLERAVRSTGFEMARIEKILLVGGSSRIPLVAEMVRAATGRPTAVDAHPKFAIALGAASQAAEVVAADGAAAAAASAAAVAAAEIGAAASVASTPVGTASAPTSRAAVAAPAPGATGRATDAPAPGPASIAPRERSGRGRRPLLVVAGIAIVAVVAIGSFALLGGGGKPAVSPPAAAGGGAAASAAPSSTPASPAAGTASPPGAPASAPPASQPAASAPVGGVALITTFAGTGSNRSSGDGGSATTAEIGNAMGVAVGPDGAVYIADYRSGSIRKVVGGTISTIATKLDYPQGIAVDATGNLFVADVGNHRIARIDASGSVTTVAGTLARGGPAGDGGPATAAQLNSPYAVAVDKDGNLYIADTKNNRIRKVVKTGTITTIAGTGSAGFGGDGGPASAAALNDPQGIAVGPGGEVYIADTGNGRVREIKPDGTISTIAGDGANTTGRNLDPGAPALQNSLGPTKGLAVDQAGNVYASVFTSVRAVVRIDAAGALTIVAGGGRLDTDGIPATEATWYDAPGLAIDPTSGTLYIAVGGKIRQVPGVGQGR